MRRSLCAALLAPLWMSAGCLFDADVPTSGEQLPSISCDADTDCPDDWFCQPTLGRCVPVAQLDSESPSLRGESMLTPAVGGLGQTFTLSFEVSEALAQDPVVHLETGGGGEASFLMNAAASDPAALAYVFTYTARGEEAEGSRLVTIDLIDTAGNAVADLSGGSLVLDFTRPRIIGHTLSRDFASLTTVHLALELSEPVPEPPLVELRSPGARPVHVTWTPEGASNSATHSYSLTTDGSEVEGVHVVQVSAVDAAGNQVQAEEVGKLTLDFTAPGAESVQILPQAAPAGQRVLVEVDLTEPLERNGALRAVPASGGVVHVYESAGGSSTRLRFEHTVAIGDDGRYQLWLEELEDRAGNRLDALALGEVYYDTTPPALSGYTQSHQSLLASDTLEVSFAASEPLATAPVVSLGGIPLLRSGTDTAPYVYTLAMGTTNLVGAHVIQVRLVDTVGNEAVLQPGVVDVDAVPPVLVGAVFTPPAARLGITAILTVTASEPLAASPTLSWEPTRGDPGFTYLGVSGLGHQYALDVTPAVEEGSYQLVGVGLRDVAGNTSQVDASSRLVIFEVDSVAPGLSSLSADAAVYSVHSGHDVITLTFNVTEDLDQGDARLEVSLGGAPFTCLPYQSWAPNYRCTYQVNGTEAEGLAIIGMWASDAAGNQTSTSLGVLLDFTPPGLLAETADLHLLPPAGCWLDQVSALGLGGTARLTFTLDEPSAPTVLPLVQASASPQLLHFSHQSGSATAFVYEHTLVSAAIPQGEYTVEVEVEDAVGNDQVLQLGALFEVDTQPPAALSAPQLDQLLYTRVPWGADGTGGASQYYVESTSSGTVEPDSALLLWSGADTDTAELIGRGQADASGAVAHIDLARSDRVELFLSQVDGACNIDSPQATRLPQGEWVATLVGKDPQSPFSNPHRASLTHRFSQTYVQDPNLSRELSHDEYQRLATISGGHVSAAVGGRWQLLQTPAIEWPNARDSFALAYDSARGRVVMFGGYPGGGNPFGDTWEWDGALWEKLEVTSSKPSARRDPAMAFDPGRQRMVLFGGSAAVDCGEGSQQCADTWEWDGESWHEVLVAGDRPSARSGHAMAYDGTRGEVMLFGGDGDDTWHWDGSVWSRAEVTGDRPSARRGFAMVSDSRRGRVVLFGGDDSNGLCGDLWEWDGTAWDEVEVTGSAPDPRRGHGMAYDSVRGTAVMFGGTYGGFEAYFGDLWEWDGATWQPRGGVEPVPRMYHAMAFDGARGQTLLFGGIVGYHSDTNDTWTWDGTSWISQAVAQAPPEYVGFTSLSYDHARAQSVLTGGETWSAAGNDFTWVFDGVSWRHRGAGAQPARRKHAAAYDSAREVVVLYGGVCDDGNCDGQYLEDTWEWDGASWSEIVVGGVTPELRAGHAMAYDDSRGGIVLFGGFDGTELHDDAWLWNGAAWSPLALDPASPSPTARHQHSLVHDDARGVLVLYGGHDNPWSTFQQALDDTWELGSTGWARRCDGSPAGDVCADTPGARTLHSMAYDRDAGVVIFFGGSGSNEYSCDLSDAWEWDGASWSEIEASGDLPGARCSHGSGFDRARGDVVVFGGYDQTGELRSETYRYRSGGADRAGLMLDLYWSAAQATGAEIVSLDISQYAGGVGYTVGAAPAPVSGVQLLAWDKSAGGAWVELASNADDAASPGLLYFQSSDPARIQALLSGPTQQELHLALVPEQPNGPGQGEVTLDYAELRVRYRLPD